MAIPLFFAASSAHAQWSLWDVSQTNDPFDGLVITATAPAIEHDSGQGTPHIVVRAKKKKIETYISFGRGLCEVAPVIQYKFGTSEPGSLTLLDMNLSVTRQSLFLGPETQAMWLKRLPETYQLLLRYRDSCGTTVNAKWDFFNLGTLVDTLANMKGEKPPPFKMQGRPG